MENLKEKFVQQCRIAPREDIAAQRRVIACPRNQAGTSIVDPHARARASEQRRACSGPSSRHCRHRIYLCSSFPADTDGPNLHRP